MTTLRRHLFQPAAPVAKLVSLAGLAALLACNDATGPAIGRLYHLAAVNGEPIPFALPGTFGDSSTPLMIVEGWVTILNSSTAERHERLLRTILTSTGDSVPLVSEWTYTGPYRQLSGRFIISYPSWTTGQIGPSSPADTFLLRAGRLTLRETGFQQPVDTLVRAYCLEVASC